MFRNVRQKCEAIRVLLRGVERIDWWTLEGPTELARQWLQAPLSSGEKVLISVCWDLWDGSASVPLLELSSAGPLDHDNTRRVLGLLTALNESPAHVDMWIDQHEAALASCYEPPHGRECIEQEQCARCNRLRHLTGISADGDAICAACLDAEAAAGFAGGAALNFEEIAEEAYDPCNSR